MMASAKKVAVVIYQVLFARIGLSVLIPFPFIVDTNFF